MIKTKANKGAEDIQAALTKLKNEADAKELQLIELVSSIYETVKEAQEKAVEKVVDKATLVNNSIHSHPWPYIGGAVMVGFVAGLFARR